MATRLGNGLWVSTDALMILKGYFPTAIGNTLMMRFSNFLKPKNISSELWRRSPIVRICLLHRETNMVNDGVTIYVILVDLLYMYLGNKTMHAVNIHYTVYSKLKYVRSSTFKYMHCTSNYIAYIHTVSNYTTVSVCMESCLILHDDVMLATTKLVSTSLLFKVNIQCLLHCLCT